MQRVVAAVALAATADALQARVRNTTVDAVAADAAGPCSLTAQQATCTFQSMTLNARTVRYAVPTGTAPAGGWPMVLLFHGWNTGGAGGWSSNQPGTFQYNKVKVKKELLERGYAVVAPDSDSYFMGGYWQTNVEPYSTGTLDQWTLSADHQYLIALLQNIRENKNWKIDVSGGLHILGCSSGGYQSSRMAMNMKDFTLNGVPFVFRSVTIVAGGPAWCGGAQCSSDKFQETLVKSAMQAHPPTLFVHGTQDTTVPMSFAQDYSTRLQQLGVPTKFYTQPVGHIWPANAPSVIADWIDTYNAVGASHNSTRH